MFASSRLRARFVVPGLFGLSLAVSGVVLPVAHAEEDDVIAAEDEEAPKDSASIKIELKQESGKVLKYDGAVLDWGADGNVEFKADNHVHDVALRVDRGEGEGKTIQLTVGYTRDGKAIIEDHTVSSEIKKREVIRIEGGIAIAITVTPKPSKAAPPPEETKPEEKPEEPSEPPAPKKRKIEGGDSDDPLDGLR
jgi:hypothetical protein